jgi:hypothetical protein
MLVSLYLIIFIWIPIPGSVKIEETTVPSIIPSSKPISNLTDVTPLPTESTNITTRSTTIENATAQVTIKNSFRTFENGTVKLIKSSEKAVNNVNLSGFLPNTLDSPSPEVRLVSISALFGLLGGTISGITSVLTRRIWDTGKYVTVRRLLYVYYARPWIAMSVGIITYVTLRAGLLNVGSVGANVGPLSEVSVISQYGVAAISALVGLMTDEIILRLRDIFRALFGITSLQKEPEIQLSLPKNSITVNEQTEISAILTDMRPTENQDLIAYFFIQDTKIVQMVPDTKRDEKFTSMGVATVTIRGNSPGKTTITVILFGDSDLYDTKEIEVT